MNSAAIRKILLTLGCASFLFFTSCAGFGRQPALSSNQPPYNGSGMDPNYPYPPYDPYYNQYYQERRPSGPGIIHFYQIDGGFGKATIYMDGERIADLREKQYFTIRVRPGVHYFTVSKPEQGGIEFRVQGNRNYFVKNSERFGGGKERLRLMNPQDGNYEISSLSPLMMKDIARDDLLVRPRAGRRPRQDIYSGY
jgi:hypothetical protein